jgi:hypothetical protein
MKNIQFARRRRHHRQRAGCWAFWGSYIGLRTVPIMAGQRDGPTGDLTRTAIACANFFDGHHFNGCRRVVTVRRVEQ